MKRFPSIVIAVALCVMTSTTSFAGEKATIRLGHPVAANLDSDVHVAALAFADYVNRHGEKIEVKIYPSGQLGNERDQVEGLQMGTLDSRTGGTAIMGNFIKQFAVLDLPFLWKDYEHFHKVIDGTVGKKLEAESEKVGIKVLSWFDSWGYRHVITRKDVKKLEDLKGLKIRCIETPTYLAAIKVMGANPTPMPVGEVYTALQTGIIDGMEHSSAVILANKFYEVSKHIVLTGHLFGPLNLNMSMKTWNKLSDYDKKIVTAGAKVAADYERSLAPIKEQYAFNRLKELGVTVTPVDTSQFAKDAAIFQNEYAAKIGATDLLEIIKSTR